MSLQTGRGTRRRRGELDDDSDDEIIRQIEEQDEV